MVQARKEPDLPALELDKPILENALTLFIYPLPVGTGFPRPYPKKEQKKLCMFRLCIYWGKEFEEQTLERGNTFPQ